MGLFDKISGKVGGKKREELYESYAESRGLRRSKDAVPPVTKSLGGEVRTVERFDGEISPGRQGTIALVETTVRRQDTVVTTHRDEGMYGLPDGTHQQRVESSADAHPGTVVMVPLESLGSTVGGLAVKRNYAKQSMGKNDAYGDLRRVPTEGGDLDSRYLVFADENADPAAVVRLFTPEFSAWLNGREEKFFSFEFAQGTLVTKRPKHPKEAEQLDGYVAETCEIARMLEGAGS